MSNDGKKKVVFYDTDKRHADLKIRLHYDGLTQTAFFRSMVSGYLDKDPAIMDFIHRTKEENDIQSAKKRKDSKRLAEQGEEIKKKYHTSLADEEVENIFDLLEEELPEL